MLDPYSFSKVVEKARHQENLLESLNKKARFQRNKGPDTTYSSQNTRVPNNSQVIRVTNYLKVGETKVFATSVKINIT